MSNSSLLFKSSLASAYFRPTADGKIFRCPSPWAFGKPREYHLTDAQAEQLIARVSRAFVVGMIAVIPGILLVCLGLIGGVYLVSSNPDQFPAAHTVLSSAMVFVFIFLLIGIYTAYVYRTGAAVLAGIPWTSVPREPYSLRGNLKKTIAIYMIFPTWALVSMLIVFLISLVMSGIPAVMTLAKGKLPADLWHAAGPLMFAIIIGVALVQKLKVRRS